MATELPVLKASDFASDQDVRWCPGCGDYSILAQMKKMLPNLGIAPENTVFISGIGCSSRFPYYMNTYGMHTIHGRAPGFATGLKVANPDLNVFLITGDGDALSIGGNHLIHLIRRNVNVTVLLFNNRIYGLTKGQYSPTSPEGKVTKSTPMGSIDHPLNPLQLVLGAGASFVARSIDFNVKHLGQTLLRAAKHNGTSFVEILQNCNVFNDGAWANLTDREIKDDNLLVLEDNQPLVFGKEQDKAVQISGIDPEVVSFDKEQTPNDLVTHDPGRIHPTYAQHLARFANPEFPVPIGVLREINGPIYEEQLHNQIDHAREAKPMDLQDVFESGDTWTVQ